MAHPMTIRPLLLDEDSIQQAIRKTGFHRSEHKKISDKLTKQYIVDLDLLALVLSQAQRLTLPLKKIA